MELDRERWRWGLREAGRHAPPRMGILLVFKCLRTLSPSTFFPAPTIGMLLLKLVLGLINAGILIGFTAHVWRRRVGWWIALAMAASLLLTTLTFWGAIRFRYPLQPVIAAFSAAWWVSITRRRAGRHAPGLQGSWSAAIQTHGRRDR